MLARSASLRTASTPDLVTARMAVARSGVPPREATPEAPSALRTTATVSPQRGRTRPAATDRDHDHRHRPAQAQRRPAAPHSHRPTQSPTPRRSAAPVGTEARRRSRRSCSWRESDRRARGHELQPPPIRLSPKRSRATGGGRTHAIVRDVGFPREAGSFARPAMRRAAADGPMRVSILSRPAFLTAVTGYPASSTIAHQVVADHLAPDAGAAT